VKLVEPSNGNIANTPMPFCNCSSQVATKSCASPLYLEKWFFYTGCVQCITKHAVWIFRRKNCVLA